MNTQKIMLYNLIYEQNALDFHLPFDLMSSSECPCKYKCVAPPILNEWDLKVVVSRPINLTDLCSTDVNWYLVRGLWLKWQKNRPCICGLTAKNSRMCLNKDWVWEFISICSLVPLLYWSVFEPLIYRPMCVSLMVTSWNNKAGASLLVKVNSLMRNNAKNAKWKAAENITASYKLVHTVGSIETNLLRQDREIGDRTSFAGFNRRKPSNIFLTIKVLVLSIWPSNWSL